MMRTKFLRPALLRHPFKFDGAVGAGLSLLFLALTYCGTFSRAREENLSRIHTGLNKAEVVAVLGEPDRQELVGTEEKWQYEIMSSDYRHSYPYTGTFENGILTKWYFNSAHNEPEKPASKAAGGKRRGAKL